MARYQVPQFIEVEDKIFGPLTFKQFIYLAGGTGFAFVIYRILPLFIGVFFILPVLVFAVALAFYKINNKPFVNAVESSFKYAIGSKLYIWRKESKKIEIRKKDVLSPLVVPKLSDSKLEDLSWSLDINNSLEN